jgi:hypothetical protein
MRSEKVNAAPANQRDLPAGMVISQAETRMLCTKKHRAAQSEGEVKACSRHMNVVF